MKHYFNINILYFDRCFASLYCPKKGKNNYFKAMYSFYISYMESEISIRTTCCCHFMRYSFLVAASDLLYAPSHRQDSTYHSPCYTNCGSQTEIRNSSLGPPRAINPVTPCTSSGHSSTELHPVNVLSSFKSWFYSARCSGLQVDIIGIIVLLTM